MTHTVNLDRHPSAGAYLTDLYLASRTGPVNGEHKKPRSALARIVGDGPLASLLRSGAPISVKPKSSSVWTVTDHAGHEDASVAFLAAVAEEMAAQGVSKYELARRVGCSHSHTSHLFSGRQKSVTLGDALKIARALGRTLAWFELHHLPPAQEHDNGSDSDDSEGRD